jgi:hypothetical protein
MIAVMGQEAEPVPGAVVAELGGAELRRRVDPVTLRFETTAEVPPLQGTVGQPRAVAAVRFGLETSAPGYNLFVSGRPGSGRWSTTRDYVQRLAQSRA